MRMYLISDNIDTYTGMRLSGVEGVVVHEREELEEALSFVTGQPDKMCIRDRGNTAIGTRSFGSDASMVADMVTKELEGLSSQGVFGAVKHFPGQGGVSGDSHDGAVTLDKSLEELMQTELVPFQKAVENLSLIHI